MRRLKAMMGRFISATGGLLLLAGLLPELHAAEIRWARAPGDAGDWSDPANWQPQQLPGPNDDVIIGGGDYLFAQPEVIVNVDSTVRSLRIEPSRPDIRVNAQLNVINTFDWISGRIHGPGAIRVSSAGVLNLDGEWNRQLYGQIRNSGFATWTEDTFQVIAPGALVNDLMGTVEVRADGLMTVAGSGPIHNLDTFRKTAGTGPFGTIVLTPFNNHGRVEVQTGVLQLSRGGSSTGEFIGPGTLILRCDHQLSGRIAVPRLEFGMCDLQPNPPGPHVFGVYDVRESTHIGWTTEFEPGATIVSLGVDVRVTGLGVFNTGQTVYFPSLDLINGTIGGADHRQIIGPLQWSGGGFNGGTTIALHAVSMSGRMQLCGTFNNTANAIWHAGSFLNNLTLSCFGGEAAHFDNSGTFEVRGFNQAIGGVINNTGSFVKAADAESVDIWSVFNNTGAVEVRGGTLRLGLGGTHASAFTGAGTLALGGTHHHDGSMTVARLVIESGHTTLTDHFSNTGSLEVRAGAVLTLAGGYTQTAGSTVVDGAIVAATVDIRGGTVTGSGSINGAAINLPPIATAGGPYVVDEGGALVLTGAGDDPDSDPLSFAWDLDNDGSFEVPLRNAIFSAANRDGPDSQQVVLRVCDDPGACITDVAVVEIRNLAPSVGAIVAPLAPVAVGVVVSASTTFSDAATADTHSGSWDWGDDIAHEATISQHTGGGSVEDFHIYYEPGIYPVQLEVQDDDGGISVVRHESIVVYDPSAGFVTGSGWIDSPAGAYALEPLATGRATFGFVSRYQKGKTMPSGRTEFHFRAGDLQFSSLDYEWLVVTGGSQAQFKGSGSLNGAGGYKFKVWAQDAPDTFRIRIWSEGFSGVETVVYDNSAAQPIGGGNIVIGTNR